MQNVHLVARWLGTLEKKLEQYASEGSDNYRVFISAEPAPTRETHIIPAGILESSIKITNEPPTGMLANLHKALDNFTQVSPHFSHTGHNGDVWFMYWTHSLEMCGLCTGHAGNVWFMYRTRLRCVVCVQDTLEMCAREIEFKSILFALCYFHAVVSERRKFGPQGWNRPYPFNTGDLMISVSVLYNYLEANSKVPWEDLRYLFGEIMYGGHITDDWDRKLCKTYLEEYMNSSMVSH